MWVGELFVESSSAIADKAQKNPCESWVFLPPLDSSPLRVVRVSTVGEASEGLRVRQRLRQSLPLSRYIDHSLPVSVAPKMAPPMMSSSNDYPSLKAIEMEKRSEFKLKKQKKKKIYKINKKKNTLILRSNRKLLNALLYTLKVHLFYRF